MGSNQTPVLSRTLGRVLHVWKSLVIFRPGEKFLSPMALIIGGVHTLLLTPPPMFRGGSGIDPFAQMSVARDPQPVHAPDRVYAIRPGSVRALAPADDGHDVASRLVSTMGH